MLAKARNIAGYENMLRQQQESTFRTPCSTTLSPKTKPRPKKYKPMPVPTPGPTPKKHMPTKAPAPAPRPKKIKSMHAPRPEKTFSTPKDCKPKEVADIFNNKYIGYKGEGDKQLSIK